MRYIDNPDLNAVELADLRGAVNAWRKAQYVPCRPRSACLCPSVAAARHIAEAHPRLSPDLVRLTDSRDSLLVFFAYLALSWMGAEGAVVCRERLLGRSFPVLDGSFLAHRPLDAAVQAAELHLRLYSPPSPAST